jgi:hypothetical protein
VHPEEWTQIAKLGGQHTYRLRKRDARFFDALAGEAVAIGWSVANGFLVPAKKWRVTYAVDDERGERADAVDFESEGAAVAEYEQIVADEVDAQLQEVKSYIFGPKGLQYWRSCFTSKPDNALAPDLAPLWYAEAAGYDGVWWEETLDPDALSAPRGAIFALEDWEVL